MVTERARSRATLGVPAPAAAKIERIAAKKKRSIRSITSLHVFRRLSFSPWIVPRREPYAVSNRRMIVQPELDKRIGIRIGQPHLPEDMKRLRCRLRGIRHDPVNYLQAIDIRIVLQHAAVRARH